MKNILNIIFTLLILTIIPKYAFSLILEVDEEKCAEYGYHWDDNKCKSHVMDFVNLNCEYIDTFYRNWDDENYGETFIDDNQQSTLNFEIAGSDSTHIFNTNYRTNWDWTGNSKYESKTTDGEFNFKAVNEYKYREILINRYDGSMSIEVGYTNDDNKYKIRHNYKCNKAEQLF